MSEIWSEQERARRLAGAATPTRRRLDAFGACIGFVAGLVLVVLLVAGAAGVVTWIWRAAIR